MYPIMHESVQIQGPFIMGNGNELARSSERLDSYAFIMLKVFILTKMPKGMQIVYKRTFNSPETKGRKQKQNVK